MDPSHIPVFLGLWSLMGPLSASIFSPVEWTLGWHLVLEVVGSMLRVFLGNMLGCMNIIVNQCKLPSYGKDSMECTLCAVIETHIPSN